MDRWTDRLASSAEQVPCGAAEEGWVGQVDGRGSPPAAAWPPVHAGLAGIEAHLVWGAQVGC